MRTATQSKTTESAEWPYLSGANRGVRGVSWPWCVLAQAQMSQFLFVPDPACLSIAQMADTARLPGSKMILRACLAHHAAIYDSLRLCREF